MSKGETHLVIGHTGSGAEAVAAKVPGAYVVSHFSTVPNEVLFPAAQATQKGDNARNWFIPGRPRVRRTPHWPMVSSVSRTDCEGQGDRETARRPRSQKEGQA